MMETTIFIPAKIKVGYQERHDTYTQKLAYVIYYDQKGTLRKEKSWLKILEDRLTNLLSVDKKVELEISDIMAELK